MFKPGVIRFCLALLVILYHLTSGIPLGGFAVVCFFVMSGYWISVMYDHKYLKTDNKLKVFYVSRIWRLLPIFYFFTICSVVLNYVFKTSLWHNIHNLSGNDLVIFWISNLTFLTYNLSKYSLLGTAWSLDVEMQFYILFPLLFYIYRNNKKFLLASVIFFLIVQVIVQLNFRDTLIGRSVFNYLYLFLLGMVMYQFKLKFSPKVEKICLSSFVLLFILQSVVPSLRRIGLDFNAIPYVVFLSKIQLLLVFPTLTNSVYNKSDKKDRVLGDLSYLIYLAHWVWILPYTLLIEHITSKLMRVPYAVGFIVVTLVSSYIVYKVFDRPIESMRRQWVDSHVRKDKTIKIA